MQCIVAKRFSGLWVLAIALVCLAGCGRRSAPRPLTPTAKLEVSSVSATQVPGARAVVDPKTGATVYLLTPPVISTPDVQTVASAPFSDGEPGIQVTLNAAGAKKMSAASTAANGKQLAIVVNGQVVTIPTVRSTISTRFTISGHDIDADKLLVELTGVP